jgi:uncharacterized protein YktB (UPF0637 family)
LNAFAQSSAATTVLPVAPNYLKLRVSEVTKSVETYRMLSKMLKEERKHKKHIRMEKLSKANEKAAVVMKKAELFLSGATKTREDGTTKTGKRVMRLWNDVSSNLGENAKYEVACFVVNTCLFVIFAY